ncbi:MAG: S9 family peptidase [Gemmatimonadetes bacterium]|nr:S9 family peptidase [Gemmatimonadota bacterium]
MRRLLFALTFALAAAPVGAQQRVPSIDDLLSVRSAGSARISPDGKRVAYVVTETDWKADAFVGQVWVADVASGERHQLTRHPKGAFNPEWSPDGQWLSFASTRDGGPPQLFAMRADGGEPVKLTNAPTGVQGYQWSKDGSQIAWTAAVENTGDKARKERYSDYDVVRRDYQYAHLFTAKVAQMLEAPQAGTQRTSGTTFSVTGFDWAPDGTRIAFSATTVPDLAFGHTSDLYVLTLADGGDQVRPLVTTPGSDGSPMWSPDGTQIAFSSGMGEVRGFARNNRIAVVSATGGTPRSLTDSFDENVNPIAWTRAGIYFGASLKTTAHLFRLDPAAGTITTVSAPATAMVGGVSVTPDGRTAAFTEASPTSLGEVKVSSTASWAPKALTTMTAQVAGWTLGTREVYRWKSKDGTEIEGILIKAADAKPDKSHPLLCVIHGGPTGVDRPTLLDARYYPIDEWVARGGIVLKVNYRGSAGYGEKFRRLNERNLGVGDAWDVLSGVDALVAQGWADPRRVASMGWSQGGYISAFLTTSSDRFKAISVGAGISNWATYYYNTDITPFTINYLGADPATDPAIYAKTSPMSYVKQAKTPTLIQHGELDRRVPIANAYELRQGLEDRGVPVEMVVYKGFGHGITKPNSQRAVMQHNLRWFNHWLWGDPLPDLRALPADAPPTP